MDFPIQFAVSDLLS